MFPSNTSFTNGILNDLHTQFQELHDISFNNRIEKDIYTIIFIKPFAVKCIKCNYTFESSRDCSIN